MICLGAKFTLDKQFTFSMSGGSLAIRFIDPLC
jgi:hypothetical protein